MIRGIRAGARRRSQSPRLRHSLLLGILGLCVIVIAAQLPEPAATAPSEGALTRSTQPLRLPGQSVDTPAGPIAAALGTRVVADTGPSIQTAVATADPGRDPAPAVAVPAVRPAPTALPAPEQMGPPPPKLEHRSVTIRSGDSLARLFAREGLSAGELHRIMHSGAAAAHLTRVHPGQQVEFVLRPDGSIQSLVLAIDRLERIEIQRERDGRSFRATHHRREPEIRSRFTEGVIDSNLFLAGKKARLTDSQIMELAAIFQWDIDFVLDIRQGDQFRVLYETRHLDDEQIGTGSILAAEFLNQGRRHVALRYVDSEGDADYYTPTGLPMRKAFLRAPVEFTRISSFFNPRRLHPVTRTVRPHRGIDYAAPRGTPVLAAGDGRIVRARRHRANGNFVVIQHGETYETKYLHLNGFGRGIREGGKVRQGQVIGYVGSTGLATGPHLHYEFLVNGVHHNPRTVPLPKAQPIAVTERPRFDEASRPLLERLEVLAAAADLDPPAAP